MACSSSAVNSIRFKDITLSSSWAVLLAPIRTEVTSLRLSTQQSAICARLCPRSAAIPFNARIFSSLSSVRYRPPMVVPALDAREPSGIPFR